MNLLINIILAAGRLLMGHSTDINENEHLQYIFNDYKSGIEHGILVANLTYELAKRLKLDERKSNVRERKKCRRRSFCAE